MEVSHVVLQLTGKSKVFTILHAPNRGMLGKDDILLPSGEVSVKCFTQRGGSTVGPWRPRALPPGFLNLALVPQQVYFIFQ